MSLIRFSNSALPLLVNEFSNRENSDAKEPFMRDFMPAVNIKETGQSFEIQMAAPGLKKENFNINLDDNKLSIAYQSEENSETANEKFIRKEFKTGTFKRTFSLNKLIDSEHIAASYVDGILQITLPKKEEVKAKPERAIEIQ